MLWVMHFLGGALVVFQFQAYHAFPGLDLVYFMMYNYFQWPTVRNM